MTPQEELELLELEREIAERAGDPGAGRRKAAVSGAVQGVVGGSVGAPGDVARLGGMAMEKLGLPKWLSLNPMQLAPSSEDIVGGMDKLFGTEFGYQPQNAEERTTQSVAAGAAGAVLPMGQMSVVPRMLLGAGGAAVGDAAGKLTGGNPWVEALSNFLTQALGGHIAAKKPQIVKTLQNELGELGEQGLRDAGKRAADVERTTGVRPVLSQATERPTALSGVSEEIGRSPQGERVRRVLAREDEVGNAKIDELLSGITPDLLGQDAANRVLGAGDKAIKRPEQVRTFASGKHYRNAKGDAIPEPQASDLAADLRASAEELGGESTAAGKAMLKRAKDLDRLIDEHLPGTIPATTLDQIQREARAASVAATKPSASSKDILRKVPNDRVGGMTNDVVKASSPELAAGKDIHSRFTRAFVDPMQQSPMTEMFTEGARATGKGNFDEMGVVLRDSERFSPSDIRFVGENLRRADPEAFPMLVKQQWESALKDARDAKSGRTPQQAMNDWANSVAGPKGSKTRANFTETIRQVAISRGQDPVAAAKGAEDLIDALHTFSADRGAVGTVNAGEMRRASGQNLASTAGRTVNVLRPLWPGATALENVLHQRTYTKIAEALTSPEGVEKLIEIAKYSHRDARLEEYLRALIATNAAEGGLQ